MLDTPLSSGPQSNWHGGPTGSSLASRRAATGRGSGSTAAEAPVELSVGGDKIARVYAVCATKGDAPASKLVQEAAAGR